MNDKLKQFYKDYAGTSLSEESKTRVKNEVFANLENKLMANVPFSFWEKISKSIMHGYILAPLVVLLFVAGTTIASAHSLPGDRLYSLKRQVENARLFMAPTEDAKQELQVDFAKERLDEATQVDKAEDSSNIELDASNAKDPEDNSDSHAVQPITVQGRHEKHSEQEIRTREDADRAIKVLEQAKKDWQSKGKDKKIEEIDNKVERYQKIIEQRDDRNQNRIREEFKSTTSDQRQEQ